MNSAIFSCAHSRTIYNLCKSGQIRSSSTLGLNPKIPAFLNKDLNPKGPDLSDPIDSTVHYLCHLGPELRRPCPP